MAVYTHRDPLKLLRDWSGERIHRAAEVELYRVDRALLDAFVARLDRRMKLSLSVTSGQLYVTIGDDLLEGALERHSLRTG